MPVGFEQNLSPEDLDWKAENISFEEIVVFFDELNSDIDRISSYVERHHAIDWQNQNYNPLLILRNAIDRIESMNVDHNTSLFQIKALLPNLKKSRESISENSDIQNVKQELDNVLMMINRIYNYINEREKN